MAQNPARICFNLAPRATSALHYLVADLCSRVLPLGLRVVLKPSHYLKEGVRMQYLAPCAYLNSQWVHYDDHEVYDFVFTEEEAGLVAHVEVRPSLLAPGSDPVEFGVALLHEIFELGEHIQSGSISPSSLARVHAGAVAREADNRRNLTSLLGVS